jgi:SAM-dependent methyltransferase
MLGRLFGGRVHVGQLMHINRMVTAVVRIRYYYLVKIRKRLRVLDSAKASENAVSHNLRNLLLGPAGLRSLKLIRPVSVIEGLGPIESQKLLSIGPRSEAEIFRLWAHGYQLSNIRGLDLISYSPWIDLGDMHAMPYADSSFDVVLCGWVLAYSEKKKDAIQEIIRVLRSGGVAAIGVEYNRKSDQELIKEDGYLAGSRQRLTSTQTILDLFDSHVDHVYVDHGIVPGVNDERGNLVVVLSIKK